jgi:hypothetical protein
MLGLHWLRLSDSPGLYLLSGFRTLTGFTSKRRSPTARSVSHSHFEEIYQATVARGHNFHEETGLDSVGTGNSRRCGSLSRSWNALCEDYQSR